MQGCFFCVSPAQGAAYGEKEQGIQTMEHSPRQSTELNLRHDNQG